MLDKLRILSLDGDNAEGQEHVAQICQRRAECTQLPVQYSNDARFSRMKDLVCESRVDSTPAGR